MLSSREKKAPKYLEHVRNQGRPLTEINGTPGEVIFIFIYSFVKSITSLPHTDRSQRKDIINEIMLKESAIIQVFSRI